VEEEGRLTNNEPGPPKKRGKKFLHITIFFIIFFLVVYFFFQPSVREGEMAPDFSLPGLKGERVHLAELRGKVVFLNFWATWCPPCIEELPSINSLYDKVQNSDFVIISVSIDQMGTEELKKFVVSNNLKFTVLHDPKSEVSAGKYGITGVPETFLIDRNGIIVKRYIGPRNWNEPEFIDYLNKLLNRP